VLGSCGTQHALGSTGLPRELAPSLGSFPRHSSVHVVGVTAAEESDDDCEDREDRAPFAIEQIGQEVIERAHAETDEQHSAHECDHP